jgi:hypothetical protein
VHGKKADPEYERILTFYLQGFTSRKADHSQRFISPSTIPLSAASTATKRHPWEKWDVLEGTNNGEQLLGSRCWVRLVRLSEELKVSFSVEIFTCDLPSVPVHAQYMQKSAMACRQMAAKIHNAMPRSRYKNLGRVFNMGSWGKRSWLR